MTSNDSPVSSPTPQQPTAGQLPQGVAPFPPPVGTGSPGDHRQNPAVVEEDGGDDPTGGEVSPTSPLRQWFSRLWDRVGALMERFSTSADDTLDETGTDYYLPSDATRTIRFGWIVILVAFVGFGGWAALAPLASAVSAQATVVMEGRKKEVQHLEGGMIQSIHVQEGDEVEKGQLLVRLVDTQASSAATRLRTQLDDGLALEARLLAERDGLEAPQFPEELTQRRSALTVQEIMMVQERQFQERRRSLEGQESILKQKIAQFEQEISALSAQREASLKQVKIFKEELVGIRELYEKGYYPRTRVLAMEREVARLEGEAESNLASMTRAEKGIGEAQLQIIQTRQRFQEEVIAQLREVQVQVADLRERLVVANDVLKRIDLVAPQTGKVQNVQVHTIGGVVPPGATLMEVVPKDDQLLIEAQVSPMDVDVIHPGQEAEIRFVAFKLRATPVILGTVRTVSGDRLVDHRTQIPYYLVLLDVSPEELAKLGKDKKLHPGMPAEVLIQVGSRTALEYIVKPLTDSLARGLNEE